MIRFINKNEIEYIKGDINIQNIYEDNVTYIIEVEYSDKEKILFYDNSLFGIKSSSLEPPLISVIVLPNGEEHFKTNQVELVDFKNYFNSDKNNLMLEVAKLNQRLKQLESNNKFVDKFDLNLKPAPVGSVITLVEGNKFELRRPYLKSVTDINGLLPSLNGSIKLTMTDLGLDEEELTEQLKGLKTSINLVTETLGNLNDRLSQLEQSVVELQNSDII